MTSTSSKYDDFVSHENHAELHIQVDGAWVQQLDRQPDPQSPAGGVSSNAVDMAQWMRMLLGNGSVDGADYIAPAVLQDTFTPQIVSGVDADTHRAGFYGLGWVPSYDESGRIYVGHAGAFSVGARTMVQILPAEQLGIVVLSNAFPTGLPEGIAYSFFDLVHQGAVSRDWFEFWNERFNGLTAERIPTSSRSSPRHRRTRSPRFRLTPMPDSTRTTTLAPYRSPSTATR